VIQAEVNFILYRTCRVDLQREPVQAFKIAFGMLDFSEGWLRCPRRLSVFTVLKKEFGKDYM
jgi:hypothetical protein